MPAGLTIHLLGGVGLRARVWGGVRQRAAGEGGVSGHSSSGAGPRDPGVEAARSPHSHRGAFLCTSHLGVPGSYGGRGSLGLLPSIASDLLGPWGPITSVPHDGIGMQGSVPRRGPKPAPLPLPIEAPTSWKCRALGGWEGLGGCPTRGRCGRAGSQLGGAWLYSFLAGLVLSVVRAKEQTRPREVSTSCMRPALPPGGPLSGHPWSPVGRDCHRCAQPHGHGWADPRVPTLQDQPPAHPPSHVRRPESAKWRGLALPAALAADRASPAPRPAPRVP